MSIIIETTALSNLMAKLAGLKDINATPLMRTWSKIMEDDNRKGILAGLDKDGVPMVKPKYRPKDGAGISVRQTLRGKKNAETNYMLKRFRAFQPARKRKGQFSGYTGIGASHVERNNNLTTQQYQLLNGPPLAPRDQFSRVISNFQTAIESPLLGQRYWAVVGSWGETVTEKGRHFLHYHFNGVGQVRRDLRGICPGGKTLAVEAMNNWIRLYVREHFGRGN